MPAKKKAAAPKKAVKAPTKKAPAKRLAAKPVKAPAKKSSAKTKKPFVKFWEKR